MSATALGVAYPDAGGTMGPMLALGYLAEIESADPPGAEPSETTEPKEPHE